MQKTDEIIQYLNEQLSEIRFRHTMGVAETAVSLAKKWGADENKAYLAGLVHDCAKEIPPKDAVRKLEDFGYFPDELELQASALLHAPLGAYLTKEVFGIHDEDVLNAVRYHTTGRVGMTLLEKIIYVADFIEPGRKYTEAQLVRTLAESDIDAAVLKEADTVIKFTIDKGRMIHPDTILARNSMLKLIKEGKTNES
ncbi:MAG: bis(5'-nucleosyl)-tetraphosphatase (symmetrical) YqeK [Clostridia bacterium]|nr:bis(5'-nucleosyl)-tetraphosphatase (symmetrical) YqeK [Clostridia bacterium]